MINLPRMHRMVWRFREDTADVFPVPDNKDSLRFAVTEVCKFVKLGIDILASIM